MKIPFKISLLMTSMAAGAVLAGCQTLDPYTGEETQSNATTGSLIGALGGAILGVATADDRRDRKKRALIGAGVGALAGGTVGNYMDRQDARLREQLQGTGVSVTRDGDNIILNMPGDITFASDSTNLQPDFRRVLDSVALVLAEYEKTVIEVAGHTDSTGSNAHNQLLAESRAYSVARDIQSNDIDQQRMLVVGYGEEAPIADNGTVSGRQKNRRVELTLVPVSEA